MATTKKPAAKKPASKPKQLLANASGGKRPTKGVPGNRLPHPIVISTDGASRKATKATKAEIAKYKAGTVTVSQSAKKKPFVRKSKRIDWEAIERDYRTGKFTFDELSAKHGPAPETLCRKAKELGWKKDLADAIAVATRIAVAEATLASGQESVKETIAAAVELNKQVIFGHREEVKTLSGHAASMLAELVATPANGELVRESLALIQEMNAEPREDETPEQRDKRIERMRKELDRIRKATYEMADIHNRVTSIAKLGDLWGKLHVMGGKAYGLDKDDGKGGSFETLLDKVGLT